MASSRSQRAAMALARSFQRKDPMPVIEQHRLALSAARIEDALDRERTLRPEDVERLAALLHGKASS